MIEPRNFGHITGGLTADPEIVGQKKNVARLRLASDYSGNDRNNPDNKSGYFTLVAFLDSDNQNSRFLFGQITDGKLKKGSQISVVYKLVNNRYTNDAGQKFNTVELIVEGFSYYGSRSSGSDSDSSSATSSAGSASVPNQF